MTAPAHILKMWWSCSVFTLALSDLIPAVEGWSCSLCWLNTFTLNRHPLEGGVLGLMRRCENDCTVPCKNLRNQSCKNGMLCTPGRQKENQFTELLFAPKHWTWRQFLEDLFSAVCSKHLTVCGFRPVKLLLQTLWLKKQRCSASVVH